VRANCSRRSWRGRGLGCGERRGHAEHGLHRQAGRRFDGGLWAVSRGLWERGRGRRGRLRDRGGRCGRGRRSDRRRGEPHHRSLGNLVSRGLQRDRGRGCCGSGRDRRRRRDVRGRRKAVDRFGLIGERLAAGDAERGEVRILRAAEGAETHRRSPLRMRVWTLARAIRRRQSSPRTRNAGCPARAAAHGGSGGAFLVHAGGECGGKRRRLRARPDPALPRDAGIARAEQGC
jgi:hypothetical protein